MSRKNFLHFPKNDKKAIIVLIVLIVIFGGAFFITKRLKKNEQKNVVSFPTAMQEKSDKKARKETKIDKKRDFEYVEKLKKGETIELNSADTSQLKSIPSIGSSFANRIVKYRNLLGGYASIIQLKEVYGMDDERYNKIRSYLTISPKIRKIHVNTIPFKELLRHPYINYEHAKVLTDLRERKGNIESMKRLELLEEFSEHDIQRLTPYLDFN